MLLGVIADDFTGASDIANTLAKGVAGEGGLKAMQFLGVPENPAPAACEAGIVSLKSRSIPAADAVAQSLAALEWCCQTNQKSLGMSPTPAWIRPRKADATR